MGKFMNPFTDVGFKHLFGREVSKDLLLELLRVILSDERYIYLSLPYFTKREEECQTDFDRWMYLLKNMDSFEKIPEYAPKSVFGKILEVADVASLNEKERWEYDQALKHYRDYNNTLHTSYRQGKEEGYAEGRNEGRSEGLAEGEAIGLTKGKSIGKEEGKLEAIRQMVQNMQEMGMDVASIAKISKLSEEEVSMILKK